MRAWIAAIAASVLVLATGASAQPAGVRVVYVPDGVAGKPDADLWSKAPEATIALLSQMLTVPNGGGSVTQVGLRAMHDGEWLAIRLEWADDTANRTVGVDAFRDAAAVGFPLGESDPPPTPFMGDPIRPVAIWQWTADLEANAMGQGEFADRYPHTDGVWYFPQDAAVRREVRAWRGHEPVVEFLAKGFGTLQRRESHNVRGASIHTKGRWQVVVRHPLRSGDPAETSFTAGATTQIIVAVWNGSHEEVNGRKNVTMNWTPFALDSTLAADAGP